MLGLVAALKQIGIYYYDTSPGNIGFPGGVDDDGEDEWLRDDPSDC